MPSIREILTTIKNAILQEIEQGSKLKEQNDKLIQQVNKLTELNSGLQAELEKTKNQEVKSLLDQLDDVALELVGIADLIPTINPTPVTDALVNEVQNNNAINTPGVLIGYEPGTSDLPPDGVINSTVEALGNSVSEDLSVNIDAGETIPHSPTTPMETPQILTNKTEEKSSGTTQISDPNIELPTEGKTTEVEG